MNLKEAFKPTPLKIFLTIVVVVLLATSVYINLIYAKEVGELVCAASEDIVKVTNVVNEARSQNISKNDTAQIEALSQSVSQQITQIVEKTRNRQNTFLFNNGGKILIGNIYGAGIFVFNPFFPAPCEGAVVMPELFSKRFCRYYIEEENYNCVVNSINEYKSLNDPAAFGSFIFFSEIPPYKKASLGNILVHSILAVLVFYILLSSLSFLNNKVSESKLRTKLIINGALLGLILFLISIIEYALILLPLVILFTVLSFMPERIKKITLIVLSLLLVLVLILSNFIINYTNLVEYFL